jgi:hypothetical protein
MLSSLRNGAMRSATRTIGARNAAAAAAPAAAIAVQRQSALSAVRHFRAGQAAMQAAAAASTGALAGAPSAASAAPAKKVQGMLTREQLVAKVKSQTTPLACTVCTAASSDLW